MRYGIQAAELKLKLRVAGVQYVTDVKRAVLEQNGQLNIVQFGEDNIRFDLIDDGQINQFTLDVIEKIESGLNKRYKLKGILLRTYILRNTMGARLLFTLMKKNIALKL